MAKTISKKKLETVKKIIELIKKNHAIMVASIKNLPSRQFQNIRKKLKGKAEVLVVKKRVMIKAIEASGNEKIQNLKEHIQEDSAVLFSKEDVFELAGFLGENKNPVKAKAGQAAEKDIEVEPGLTEMVPGPAISELGALGIKIAVEDGKIAIKDKKVIVKAGEKISAAAASIMAKLDILPFEMGLEPIAMCEIKEGKIYTGVKIDRKKAMETLKYSFSKALAFAVKIAYPCKETISLLIQKAGRDEKMLTTKIQQNNTGGQ